MKKILFYIPLSALFLAVFFYVWFFYFYNNNDHRDYISFNSFKVEKEANYLEKSFRKNHAFMRINAQDEVIAPKKDLDPLEESAPEEDDAVAALTQPNTSLILLRPDAQKFRYSLLIQEPSSAVSKGNIFLKSNVNIKNGVEMVVLSQEGTKKDKNMLHKKGYANQEQVAEDMEGQENESALLEQVRLTANVDKDKNILSSFTWQTLEMANKTKIAGKKTSQEIGIDESAPLLVHNKKSITVVHKYNEEASFSLNGKQFTIKAVSIYK